MNEKEYSVSEAVRRTGVPSHVLRYWEDELQITIQRSSQGYRIYRESDLELFRKVKMLKEKGIQLKAIRVLLEEQEREEIVHEENAWTENVEEAEEVVCGIVLQTRQEDKLERFEAMMKHMMEEVLLEQNEKLELSIRETIREELEELCIRYFEDAYREAAADMQKKMHWWERWKRR